MTLLLFKNKKCTLLKSDYHILPGLPRKGGHGYCIIQISFFAVNCFNKNMFNSERRINIIWGILSFWLFVSTFYLFLE